MKAKLPFETFWGSFFKRAMLSSTPSPAAAPASAASSSVAQVAAETPKSFPTPVTARPKAPGGM